MKCKENTNVEEVYNETTLLHIDEKNEDGETTLLSYDENVYNETTLLSQDEEDYNETTLLSQDEEDYNETTLLSSDNGASLLSGSSAIPKTANQAVLCNIISQEKINITKTPFTIGSSLAGVDFYVSNSAVSRKHSLIIFNKNEYYIIDNSSTNHTVLDGMVIEPQKAVKLYHGALIEMADELFQFNILKN